MGCLVEAVKVDAVGLESVDWPKRAARAGLDTVAGIIFKICTFPAVQIFLTVPTVGGVVVAVKQVDGNTGLEEKANVLMGSVMMEPHIFCMVLV